MSLQIRLEVTFSRGDTSEIDYINRDPFCNGHSTLEEFEG